MIRIVLSQKLNFWNINEPCQMDFDKISLKATHYANKRLLLYLKWAYGHFKRYRMAFLRALT